VNQIEAQSVSIFEVFLLVSYELRINKMDSGLVERVGMGEIDPEVAADQANQFVRVSKEEIDELDRQIINSSNTRHVDQEILIRLSRFNHCLSLGLAEESLTAQTAFTLAQMLVGNPAFIEERVQLVEYAVPIIEKQGRPAETMAMIFYYTAMTYNDLSIFDKVSCRKVVEFGNRALDYFGDIKNAPIELLQQLYLCIGTALNSLAEASESDLTSSVAYLRKAVELARDSNKSNLIGSSLNNLGHALHLLGKCKSDPLILQEAIKVLNRALPFRKKEDDIKRTQGNIVATQKTLQKLKSGSLKSFEQGSSKKMTDGLIGAVKGEQYIKWLSISNKTSECEERQILEKAMKSFCDATRLSAERTEPDVRAHAEMGIGIILKKGKSGAEVGMAICFLRASERRWQALNEQKRVAVVHFNLGEAFSTLLDSRGELSYIDLAVRYFGQAWEEFRNLGLKEESTQSLIRLALCYRIMGESGDTAAMKRSEELFELAGIKSEKKA
jgi:tetratricopeptide (TPR) repeat protein